MDYWVLQTSIHFRQLIKKDSATCVFLEPACFESRASTKPGISYGSLWVLFDDSPSFGTLP